MLESLAVVESPFSRSPSNRGQGRHPFTKPARRPCVRSRPSADRRPPSSPFDSLRRSPATPAAPPGGLPRNAAATSYRLAGPAPLGRASSRPSGTSRQPRWRQTQQAEQAEPDDPVVGPRPCIAQSLGHHVPPPPRPAPSRGGCWSGRVPQLLERVQLVAG